MTKQPSSDTALYERVALELETGDKQTGLWTKAFALADGDEQKTKARYISLRVAQLAELEPLVGNASATSPDSLNKFPERRDSPLDEKSEQSGDQHTQPRGLLLATVDTLPAFSCSLYLIGVALAVVIPSFFDKGRLSNVEVIAAFVIGTLLATTVLVMALWPKKNVGSVTFVWKRLGAKYLDFFLVGLLIAVGLGFSAPLSQEAALLTFVGGTLLGWMLLETLGLDRYGTTPGRALLGIKVRKANESANFLVRSLSLYFWGFGLSIPIVTGITQAIAYKRFRETGETRWDAGKFDVSSTSIGIGRLIVFALVLMFLLVISIPIGKSIGRNLVHTNLPSVSSLPAEIGDQQSSDKSKEPRSSDLPGAFDGFKLIRRADKSKEPRSSDLPGASAQDVDTPRSTVGAPDKGRQGLFSDLIISAPEPALSPRSGPAASQLKQRSEGQKPQIAKDSTPRKKLSACELPFNNLTWTNCHGTFTHADGREYSGEFQYGRFSGQGTMKFPDGRKYIGNWKSGDYHGRGALTFPDGRTFAGEFFEDKPSAKGTVTFPDGSPLPLIGLTSER